MVTEGWVRPKRDAEELIERLNVPNRPDRVVFSPNPAGPSRIRLLTHLVPWGTGVQYRVHCPDVKTAMRGLLERVFYHWEEVDGRQQMVRPHQPTQEIVDALLGRSRAELLRRTGHVTPWTRDQFLAPLGGSKLARYSDAADSVEADPVTERDAYLQTFVKAEKLNVTAKSDPDPRVIQPRNPRYCYAVGLYIKACEHMVYKAINRMFGRKTVMKGLNADERGAAFSRTWAEFVDPVAIGLDASRFDQHVSRVLLEFEHSVYNSIYHEPELARLLRMQLVNKGFVRAEDGTIKYTVEGSRMSGDMNTSLGNVLLMCLMCHAYLAGKPFKTALLNDGDDCVVMCERENVEAFADIPEWFRQLGMIMKVDRPVFVLEEVQFCQSQPVEVQPGCWRMVRDPNCVLSKDACVVKPVRDKTNFDFFRKAISDCGLALAGDVPVFCEYYTALGRSVNQTKRFNRRWRDRRPETGMDFLALRMPIKYQEPSVCARVSFSKAFGIWPDQQVAMEQEYRRAAAVWARPTIVSHVVERFDSH